MEIINKLIVLNNRNQLAYQEYLTTTKYYQANRIYSVNTEILNLLKEFQFICDKDIEELTIKYIFHLEDWILQFLEHKKKIKSIQDKFVFDKLNESFEFPNEFYKKLKKIK